VCKDRKKLLNTYGKVVKRQFEEIGARSDFSFETMGVDKIIFIAVSKASPAFHPLPLCAEGPQESTFQLWRSYEADLTQHFWKKRTFWSDGYFCCTIGNASQEAIRHSIANQG